MPGSARSAFRPGSLRPVLVLAAMLAACAGDPVRPEAEATRTEAPAQAQVQEYQRIVNELRRASQCVIKTEDDPRFAPLQAKAPGSAAAGTAFLADPAKPSETERRLIEDFTKAIVPCEPDFGVVVNRHHQSITRMINDTWRRQEQLYGLLRDGAVTWGQFNQNTKANADKLSGGLEALRLINEG
jgi:hypothetical protein